MARIRTIKPDFFRDEDLQDLEAANPGEYVMLVFAGLWGHCDKAGRFPWQPRQLKLDILPFLQFDMVETLATLEKGGFLVRYEVEGKAYGSIPTFGKHQRIGGKEAQEPERFPAPSSETPKKRVRKYVEAKPPKQGSNGEAHEKHLPAQEEEGNGEREGNGNSCVVTREASSEQPAGQTEPETVETITPTAEVIRAFDEERVKAFGPSQARPYPNQMDLMHAQRWLDAGATVDLCRSVFAATFARKAANGEQPIGALSYFVSAISDAIAQSKKPLPKAPTDDDLSRDIPPFLDSRRKRPAGGFDAAIAGARIVLGGG